LKKSGKSNSETKKPFSVIAPSIKWIKQNLIIDVELEKYLPGPYTIILKKKKFKFMDWVSNTDSLGIRIPDNDFCRKVQKSGVPFITTSINLSGQPSINNIKKIPKKILNSIDIIIKGKDLTGNPSTLIIEGKEVERK
jgi:L-threonylcarbamoyladenylate synthase